MYKFSKFSKFISACFSFGILFSGLQTYGVSLDMLGIGRNRNQDDDNLTIKTSETMSSVLDGIKVEFPEQCKFCSQKALRVVAVPNSRDICICRDNNCLKKIFDEFNIELNTENIHRCDWFKSNMQKFQEAKVLGCENLSLFELWKIVDEDKLIDEVFLLCGHSICRCRNCISQFKNADKLVCPTCKATIRGGIVVSSTAGTNTPRFQTQLKIIKLLSEKLKNEWENTIVLSDTPYNNIDKIASFMFYRFIDGNMCNFTFCENRLNKIDGELALGEKILVFDMTTAIKDSLKFLPWNKFDGYIKSLKECGKDKMIVYPTNGELYDKIQAAMNK